MDQVIIRDLTAHSILGVYEWERHQPRPVLLSLILYTDLRKAGASDNLNDSIDYDQVSRQVVELVESARRLTVEALAEDIARLCLSFAGVQKVRVRVEKPGAVAMAGSVGVEIERQRDE